jgi:cobalt-zinc-cadmium efflux system outer membrane protein
LKTILIFGALLVSPLQMAYGYSFNDAVKQIESHEIVGALKAKSGALSEQGNGAGSWGDPMIKLAAKNFPKDSLDSDQSPMTGIELAITQKIALTNKYGNLKDSFEKLGEATLYAAENKKEELIKKFWEVISNLNQLKEEIKINQENIVWLDKILKVSKKLYTNGKISQQGLLDLKIRKSELEAAFSSKSFEYKENESRLGYLLGLKGELDLSSVPWKLARREEKLRKDFKELSLGANLDSKQFLLSAQKKSFVPDLTFSLGYTKRSDIDNKGDFVSASVAFPIPTSSKKYAAHSEAVYKKSMATMELKNYQRQKVSLVEGLNFGIEKLKAELNILNSKTIKFSENSRDITAKSYRYGRASYVELLQSELKHQMLLIKRSILKSQLIKKQIEKKFILGEKLYE